MVVTTVVGDYNGGSYRASSSREYGRDDGSGGGASGYYCSHARHNELEKATISDCDRGGGDYGDGVRLMDVLMKELIVITEEVMVVTEEEVVVDMEKTKREAGVVNTKETMVFCNRRYE
ncbi:unnamed protein product, partial [Brassica oleracea var. botrytis]